ncbi:MAG: polysaccharide deacetylase family protein [Gammaproteobacteria bacterium]
MKHLLSILFHDVYAHDPAESGFLEAGAEHYKIPLQDFERHLLVLSRNPRVSPKLVTKQSDDAEKAQPLAVTVDDGGISYYTEIAERLEAIDWRAHCFVTTGRIGQRGFLGKHHIRELHARGHVIGSHSVSHPKRFAACKWEDMVFEWERSRKTLQDILGQDVTTASVPGGYFSGDVARAAMTAGIRDLFTSEPETRVRNVDGCSVYGRYTVRSGCSPEFITALSREFSLRRYQEWILWNSKKIAKRILGAGYPQLAQWVLRLGR